MTKLAARRVYFHLYRFGGQESDQMIFLDPVYRATAACLAVHRTIAQTKQVIRDAMANKWRPDELDLIALYEEVQMTFNGKLIDLFPLHIIRQVHHRTFEEQYTCRINDVQSPFKSNYGIATNPYWAQVYFVGQLNSDGWRVSDNKLVKRTPIAEPPNSRYIVTLDFFVEVRYLIKDNGRRVYDS